MALIIGTGVATAYRLIAKLPIGKYVNIAYVFAFSIYASFAYATIAKESHQPDFMSCHWEYYDPGYLLRDAIRSNEPLGSVKVVYPAYVSAVLFYVNVANEMPGNNISFSDVDNLQIGDTVLCSFNDSKTAIRDRFSAEILLSRRTAEIIVLTEKDKKIITEAEEPMAE